MAWLSVPGDKVVNEKSQMTTSFRSFRSGEFELIGMKLRTFREHVRCR